jgi:hypothetical protein
MIAQLREHIQKRIESRDLDAHDHRSIIHNSYKVELTHVSTNGHICEKVNKILSVHTLVCNSDTCSVCTNVEKIILS